MIPVRSGRDDVRELIVPANEAAIKLGSVKCANIIAVSAFAAKSEIVDIDILRECVKKEFAKKPKIVPLNMKAFDEGLRIAGM